jgi:beta-lysine 5,6-aminomutase alpha subunit
MLVQRAKRVLAESVDLLGRVADDGLLNAIAEGTFGITRRPPDGGKGLDGVIARADGYVNPAIEILDTEDPHAARADTEQEVPA